MTPETQTVYGKRMFEIIADPAISIKYPSGTEGLNKFSVNVVTTSMEFDSLGAEWNQLLDESNGTVFQSFEWQRIWWKHFGEQDAAVRLHIITLRRRGKLVAIAPFLIESMKRLGSIRLRRLSFIGRDTTDYLDILIAKGHETDCVPILASHIRNQSSLFDVIHLIDMPDRSPNHALFYQELCRRGFWGDHFVSEHCPRVKLQTTWDAMQGSLPSSKRSGLKRVQRKIETDFDVELRMVTEPCQLSLDFAEFVNLHQKRWNGSGHQGVFADTRTADFHREFSEIALKRKWLFLAFLLLDGKRIAANYGFVFRKELLYYLSGIEIHGQLAKYSLGRVLHLYSISEAIKQGIEVYDFMRGTERYKYDFNSVDATNWTVLMYPYRIGLSQLKFKIVLLVDSMKRRIARERLLWSQVSKEQRALSGGLAAHVARRIQTDIKDGIQKLRSPEKSITNGD